MGGGDQCWVGAGGDQLSDELLGIGGADDRLTDKDDVGAAASELTDVMGPLTPPAAMRTTCVGRTSVTWSNRLQSTTRASGSGCRWR